MSDLPSIDRTRSSMLMEKYQVTGIPCLVIVSSSGEILIPNAVQQLYNDGVDFLRQWSKGKYLSHE